VPSATIAPSLGRALNSATATIPVIVPFSIYDDRITQLDVRLQKTWPIGRARLQTNFDVYNIFNASTLLAANFTYPANFLKPTQILGARLFKFSGQLNF
jgi:hypothetical protein